MKKKLLILFFVMLMTALLGIVASANPDGPQFTLPEQYSEHKIGENIYVRWDRPDGGEGSADSYIFAVRIFGIADDVTSDNTGIRIINEQMLSYRSTYTIEGSLLDEYASRYPNAKLRLSVCAVQYDGTKKWSDAQYIYISAHNTPKDTPVSFHIYNGFTQETKEQIYYACQNWNNHLNLGREIVNTYPYDQGTNKVMHGLDGENIVTKRKYSSNAIMTTHIYFTSTYYSKHLLDQADIVINANYPWANSPQNDKYYIYNEIIHEIGHVIGLNDKYDSWAKDWTMYGRSGYGESKSITLEEQDIKNGRSLYQ